MMQKLFSDEKIKWRLVASTALLVHGIKVMPKDVDIAVDKEDFEAASKVIRTYFNHRTNELIFDHKPSRVTSFELWPIRGEILEADFDYSKAELKDWQGLKVEVNSLEDELRYYKQRPGKEKIVKLIEEKL